MSRKKRICPTLNQKISAHYSAIWCIFIVIENLTVHERLPMNKRTNLEKMPISVSWVVRILIMILKKKIQNEALVCDILSHKWSTKPDMNRNLECKTIHLTGPTIKVFSEGQNKLTEFYQVNVKSTGRFWQTCVAF